MNVRAHGCRLEESPPFAALATNRLDTRHAPLPFLVPSSGSIIRSIGLNRYASYTHFAAAPARIACRLDNDKWLGAWRCCHKALGRCNSDGNSRSKRIGSGKT